MAYLGWLHSRILCSPESGAVSLPRKELEAGVFVIVIASSYFTIWLAMTKFPPSFRCYRNRLELERHLAKDEQ